MCCRDRACPVSTARKQFSANYPLFQLKFMNDQKDKSPLFKSWKHWYVLVIGFLILLILLFYWLTKTFA